MSKVILKRLNRFVAVIAALSVYILASGFSVVFADVIKATQQGSVIVVTGSVPSKKAGVNVTIAVLKKDKTVEDLKVSSFKENVDYLDQTLTTAGGTFCFDVMLPKNIDEGNIAYRVGSGEFQTASEQQIMYIPVEKIKAAIDLVNKSCFSNDSIGAITGALSANVNILGLDITGAIDDFNSLKNKNSVYNYLLDIVKKTPYVYSNNTELKTSIAKIRNDFKVAVAISAIDQADSEQLIDSLLTRYSDALSLDTAKYESLDNGQFGISKRCACNVIMNSNLATKKDVQDALAYGVALATLNAAASKDAVRLVIESYSACFGIDIGINSDFNKINNKDYVYGAIADSLPFSSIDEVFFKFNSAVSTALTNQNRSQNTGGLGAGSNQVIVSQPMAPLPTPVTESLFKDISSVPWAVDSINHLTKIGVLNGRREGVFAPDEPVTRAEFAKMLAVAFNLQKNGGNVQFSDVSEGQWYYPYIISLYSNGVVNGKDDGSFGVNEPITRQDMAVMSFRASLAAGINISSGQSVEFSDASEISEYALESVQALSSAGVINGVGDNKFAPIGTATRAQAAKIVNLLLSIKNS